MKKEKTPEIPLWENDMPEICRFCAFAARIAGSEAVFCEKKKQVFPEDNTCKKYKFDILKREVRRRKNSASKYAPEQFEI